MGITIDSSQNKKKLVVITGCDTGLGKILAEILLDRGYKVAISYLQDNPFSQNSNIYSKKMDLRIPEEVNSFCLFIKEILKDDLRLGALISNAGVTFGGPVENVPISLYREIFEINFFGGVSIIQALIPELIENKGRIIIIGSMAGKVALPFFSPYVSTKFALEGFSDSLRREMNPFGIKTILVEPAAVATPIWNKGKTQNIEFIEEKYLSSFLKNRNAFIDGGNKGLNQETAAVMIADMLSVKNPKARYIIAKNILTTKLTTLLPSLILDKALSKLFPLNYK